MVFGAFLFLLGFWPPLEVGVLKCAFFCFVGVLAPTKSGGAKIIKGGYDDAFSNSNSTCSVGLSGGVLSDAASDGKSWSWDCGR